MGEAKLVCLPMVEIDESHKFTGYDVIPAEIRDSKERARYMGQPETMVRRRVRKMDLQTIHIDYRSSTLVIQSFLRCRRCVSVIITSGNFIENTSKSITSLNM